MDTTKLLDFAKSCCKGSNYRISWFVYALLLSCLSLIHFLYLLHFSFILADERLNEPGATLYNNPSHRVNDAKYHCMTAEECLNHLNDMLMDVFGVNTSSFGSLLAVKVVAILIQTFVLKVVLEELSGKWL